MQFNSSEAMNDLFRRELLTCPLDSTLDSTLDFKKAVNRTPVSFKPLRQGAAEFWLSLRR